MSAPLMGGAFRRSEDGASAVEFAILAPLVFMLIFGMLTGGLALNRRIALTHASREAVRYGATLKLSDPLSTWLEAVADRAELSAAGELGSGHSDRYICVAFVATTAVNIERGADRIGGTSACYDDGRPAEEPRVQVVVERLADFNAVLFFRTITLQSAASARYELDPDP